MDGLSLFGLFAVTMMLVCYALEDRHRGYVLAFATACGLGSAYGFLQGAWPFVILSRVASRAYRKAAGLSSTGSSVVGKPGNKRCHCRRWAIRYCVLRTVPHNVGR